MMFCWWFSKADLLVSTIISGCCIFNCWIYWFLFQLFWLLIMNRITDYLCNRIVLSIFLFYFINWMWFYLKMIQNLQVHWIWFIIILNKTFWIFVLFFINISVLFERWTLNLKFWSSFIMEYFADFTFTIKVGNLLIN